MNGPLIAVEHAATFVVSARHLRGVHPSPSWGPPVTFVVSTATFVVSAATFVVFVVTFVMWDSCSRMYYRFQGLVDG